MRPFDRLRAAWGNLGVTAKLGLGFALLFCMILVEAAASLIALGEVRRAEAVILNSVEIRQRIFEMDGQLEKARRLHRDFFLQYPRIGFLPAQELYFHPATEVIAQVVALSGELKRLVDTSGVSEALRDRSNDLTLYLNTATRFSAIFQDLIALVTTLAAPETGLESQIDALENAIGDYSEHSPQTLLPFQKMVLHHRRYTITRQRPDMQSALNACNELRRAIATDHGFKPADQTKALRLLARYATVAKQIPDIDMAIRGKLNDFTLQARAVDPISENLKAIATQEVERANNRIVLASRISAGVIILMAVVGLGFVLLVAAILHASVTRKLVALTHFAEQMRAGNFETAVDLNSHDEVGILAASFKDMAERMRQLFGNLEHRVEQRTAELTEARDRLEALVAELDDKNQALEILSVTDRLTGLANRRKLESSLQAELLRSRRYGKGFSIMLLDIDLFKSVNDTHGHQAGDAVLVRLAELLRSNSRETDIVGRWGGEEFLIICPETSLMLVAALAERYRMEMERCDFGHVGRITASFGVTCVQEGDTVPRILRRADQALYRAKETGRNRVEAHGTHALH